MDIAKSLTLVSVTAPISWGLGLFAGWCNFCKYSPLAAAFMLHKSALGWNAHYEDNFDSS